MGGEALPPVRQVPTRGKDASSHWEAALWSPGKITAEPLEILL
jgi:hypothetical protein